MKTIPALVLLLIVVFSANLLAASFHWVDADGFHAVDQVTKVPLEHRLELPMVKNRIALPFTEEEDKDGAMYVWFVLNQAGINTPFTKAVDLPKSPVFIRIELPQTGDIAWWKGFMAIADKTKANLLTARGEQSRKSLEKKYGKLSWYRYNGPTTPAKSLPDKTAPLKSLKIADQALARLDKTAEFPLQVKEVAVIETLKKEWEKAVANMESLRKKYPEDPQVLRRLGVLYRRGYTLEIPGSWERAEAYLLKTQNLAADLPDSYISLGILYGDTGPEYAPQAEAQFRKALGFARKEQQPQIWWGLAISLVKQEKFQEALKAADRLIKLRPTDVKAKDLRKTILETERLHRN